MVTFGTTYKVIAAGMSENENYMWAKVVIPANQVTQENGDNAAIAPQSNDADTANYDQMHER